jgi:hypothetical protein
MATTTPNYGWTVPTSTDLVKDGATAIETLGDAIDASMNTALGTKKAGMVLLNTTSFSGVSSQSINDVFSATYDNYRIIVTGVSVSGPALGARLRVGGTDNSTASSYVIQTLLANSTGVSGSRVTDSQWFFGNMGISLVNGYCIDLFDPFKASATGFSSFLSRSDSGAFLQIHSGTHNQTVSYTGFTLLPGSSITGSVSVYGYNK